jgi:putative PIN family toxin of toxin-antitoxin system
MTSQIFIDTNVWFSAFYGSENAEKIIKAHINGQIKAVVSQQVLEELVKNISTKLPAAIPGLQRLMESAPPMIVSNPYKITEEYKLLAGPKDLPILISASQANIKYFVTGNIKDFDLLKIKDELYIDILTPKEFVHSFINIY